MELSVEKVSGTFNGINYDSFYLVSKELNIRIKIKSTEKFALNVLADKCKK